MKVNRWPEIDGLRALCATAVMFAHWGPPRLASELDIGDFGVICFFVISGFLITRILLDARDGHSGETNIFGILKVFYARRALRIFPVYYITLTVCATLVAMGRLKIEGLPWHFAYLSNVYVFINQHWPRVIGPVWSLSVEEQFYLLWPAAVLLTPRAILRDVIVAAIVAGFGFRSILILSGFGLYTQTGTLLPSCVDTLGLGALLATLTHKSPLDPRPVIATAVAGIASYVLMIACSLKFGSRIPYTLDHVSIGMISVALVGLILSNKSKILLSFLNFYPIRYIGVISYGIYLFHPIVQYFVDLISFDLVRHNLSLWPRFAVCFTATVGAASVSWFLLEKPLLRLKDRFRYLPARRPEPETIARAA